MSDSDVAKMEDLMSQPYPQELEVLEVLEDYGTREEMAETIVVLRHLRQDAETIVDKLFTKCNIVYYPKDGRYPLEHNPHANKDGRAAIENELK